MNRNHSNLADQIAERYRLIELQHHVFSITIAEPCSECEGTDSDCSWCDGEGQTEQRSEFVNARRLFAGQIGNTNRFLVVADYGSFVSVNVTDRKFALSEERFRLKGSLNRASSTEWVGQLGGSGIKRVPETIRGQMWRTSCMGHDMHVQPEDIVQLLLAYCKS